MSTSHLLRVIADRIDAGWPEPHDISLGDESPVLSFHDPGNAHEPWVRLFEGLVDSTQILDVPGGGQVSSTSFAGRWLEQPVEIAVYSDLVLGGAS